MLYVYILQNPAGRFYIAQTNDIDRRIRHNKIVAGTFAIRSGDRSLGYTIVKDEAVTY